MTDSEHQDRRANDSKMLSQQALVLDALFGIHRPPLKEDTQYFYDQRMTNGMSHGIIEAVRTNRDSIADLVESKGDTIRFTTKQIIGIIVALASAVGADRLLS